MLTFVVPNKRKRIITHRMFDVNYGPFGDVPFLQ